MLRGAQDVADSKTSLSYSNAWHGQEPYDRQEVIRLERAGEILRRHAEVLRVDRRYRILDVGCGVGPLRQWLDAGHFEIVGLEISQEGAAIAARNYDKCEVADIEEPWPVEPASFDGLHAGAILEHVVNWHAPLNYANRALRDDGLIVVSVPNLRYWKEVRKLIVGKQPHWMRDVAHLHAYTPLFLHNLVTLHGFEVVDLQADRVNLPLLKWCDKRIARWLPGIGSVLILTAALRRRVRVEADGLKSLFPNHKPVGLRSIEIPPE